MSATGYENEKKNFALLGKRNIGIVVIMLLSYFVVSF